MSLRGSTKLTRRQAILILAGCGWLICFGAMFYYDQSQHRHWPSGPELREIALISMFMGPALAGAAAWKAGVIALGDRASRAAKVTLFVVLLAVIGLAFFGAV